MSDIKALKKYLKEMYGVHTSSIESLKKEYSLAEDDVKIRHITIDIGSLGDSMVHEYVRLGKRLEWHKSGLHSIEMIARQFDIELQEV